MVLYPFPEVKAIAGASLSVWLGCEKATRRGRGRSAAKASKTWQDFEFHAPKFRRRKYHRIRRSCKATERERKGRKGIRDGGQRKKSGTHRVSKTHHSVESSSVTSSSEVSPSTRKRKNRGGRRKREKKGGEGQGRERRDAVQGRAKKGTTEEHKERKQLLTSSRRLATVHKCPNAREVLQQLKEESNQDEVKGRRQKRAFFLPSRVQTYPRLVLR